MVAFGTTLGIIHVPAHSLANPILDLFMCYHSFDCSLPIQSIDHSASMFPTGRLLHVVYCNGFPQWVTHSELQCKTGKVVQEYMFFLEACPNTIFMCFFLASMSGEMYSSFSFRLLNRYAFDSVSYSAQMLKKRLLYSFPFFGQLGPRKAWRQPLVWYMIKR